MHKCDDCDSENIAYFEQIKQRLLNLSDDEKVLLLVTFIGGMGHLMRHASRLKIFTEMKAYDRYCLSLLCSNVIGFLDPDPEASITQEDMSPLMLKADDADQLRKNTKAIVANMHKYFEELEKRNEPPGQSREPTER